MKIIFLGVGGALSIGYNSNMLIEQNDSVMLFDCGEDVMHSLRAAGRKPEELTAVYISHLHFDHCGGLSWLGYYSYFIMKRRLVLYIHESMVSDLWGMLRPAMEKLDGQEMKTLDNYFVIIPFKNNQELRLNEFIFKPNKQLHVETHCGNMYSYGVVVTPWGHPNDSQIFISSDTKDLQIPICPFNNTLFSDCDVMNLSGIHPNYDILKKLQPHIKEKMWLYHYTDLNDYDGKYGEMPDAEADGFAGFVKEGQVFEI